MIRLVIIGLSIALTGCFQTPLATQGSVLRSQVKGLEKAQVLSSTKSVATVAADATDNVTLAVADTSTIAGTSITIPPGSLSIATSIIIEQGADFADTSIGQEVALIGDAQVSQAGNGIIVRPSTTSNLAKPITLNLPLPVRSGLHLTTPSYAVYYKYLDPTTNQLVTGMKVVDGAEVKLVYDENSKQDVIQIDGYFGAYWVVIMTRDVAKEEIPAPKVSTQAITNKANATVFDATGVVAETKVAAVQAKPEIQWKKPVLTLLQGVRKAQLVADMSSFTDLKSCKIDIFENTTDASGRNFDATNGTNFTFAIEKLTAQKMVGRFRCVDGDNRATISPWSDSLAVDAYRVVNVTTVKSSGSGAYKLGTVVPIYVNFSSPVYLQGSPVLALRTGSLDRNAIYVSGSGTNSLLFNYTVSPGDQASPLNYTSNSALSLMGGSLIDVQGVAVNLTLPSLDSPASLAMQSPLLIATNAPTAPTSVGFASTTTINTQFSATWNMAIDPNFKQFNAKLCGLNDCTSSCGTLQSFTQSTATFTAGIGGPYYACVQSEDMAGNQSSFVPSANGITVLGAGPMITSVTTTLASGSFKAGNTIPIAVNFSTPVTVANGSQLGLQLNTTPGRTAIYSSGSGTASLNFTYDIATGDMSTRLNYASINALTLGSGGTIRDASAVDAILQLPALASTNSLGTSKNIVIDTTPPPAPTLTAPIDGAYLASGTVTAAGQSEPFTVVNMSVDSVGTGSATANAAGVWSYAIPSTLADGNHSIVAQAVDAAGNMGPPSASVGITVHSAAPRTPTTNTIPPTMATPSVGLTGTADPNVNIQVKNAGTILATTTANGSGAWSTTVTGLTDGNYALSVIAVDAAMRSSAPSSVQNFIVDTIDPTPPSAIVFPMSSSASTTVSVDFTPGTDAHFKGTNVKLCTSSACNTGCTAVSQVMASPANLVGVNGNTYYACMQSEDNSAHISAWVASSNTINISTTGTTITSVTSSKADGYYKAGEVIPIIVTFSAPVTYSGSTSTTLAMNTGSSAQYASSSGNSVSFTYTVQAGDNVAKLDYNNINAFSLAGGATLVDAATSNAVLVLPPTGSAGSLGGSKNLTLDNTPPTAPSSIGFSSSVSNTASFPMNFVSGMDTNLATHNLKLCTANDCSTGCTAEIQAVTSPNIMTGVNGGVYYGCAQAQDSAGTKSAYVASITTIAVDTSAPTIIDVTSNRADGAYKVNDTIDIQMTFTEPVFVTNQTNLNLILETGVTDHTAIYTSGNGTPTLTFTYTVQPGDTSADLDYQNSNSLTLGLGTIKDAAGNNAVILLPTVGGSHSIAGQKSLVIDTTPPVAPTFTTPAGGAYLTSSPTSVTGAAESGAMVTVKIDGVSRGQSVASSGTWTVSSIPTLTDGTHNMTATATDAAGNVSPESAPVSIIVDSTPPAPPTLATLSGFRNTNTILLTGTSEPNMGIALLDGGTATGPTTMADASGNWSFSPFISGEGVHNLSVRAFDPASRTSSATSPISITIDTTPPVLDNGGITDFPINSATGITINSSETPASVSWSKVSGPGTVTFSPPNSLSPTLSASADGIYVVRVTATDQAGNQGVLNFNLIWDQTIPNVSPIITGVARSSSGAYVYWRPGADAITAQADLTYTVCYSSSSTACASNTGTTFEVQSAFGKLSTVLSSVTTTSPFYFSVRAKDAAGNAGAYSPTFYSAPITTTATKMSSGDVSSCALIASQVKCWGNNDNGQLGDGTLVNKPFAVTALGVTSPSKVVVGGATACALTSAGSVYCWGNNLYGQVGNGQTGNLISTPTQVNLSGATAIDIDVGGKHACAVLLGGTVKCWGDNTYGQLGDGTTIQSPNPVLVAGISSYSIVSVGLSTSTTCVLTSTMPYCWGGNSSGQVGNGTTADTHTPTAISGAINATFIHGGNDYNCATFASASMKCWGNGLKGQMGNGMNLATNSTPTMVSGGYMPTASDVSIGTDHVCMKVSSQFYCWGSNTNAQLGTNIIAANNPSPTAAATFSGATLVSTGAGFTCGAFSGGIQCIGANTAATLGIGAGSIKDAPVDVGLSSVQQVAIGDSHACAISGSALVCRGSNADGQTGNTALSTLANPSPYSPSLSPSPIQVATSNSSTCVVLGSGQVKCFGAGTSGVLGTGSTGSVTAATSTIISGLTNISSIYGGASSFCALNASGQAYCWGDNTYGQLGDGTTTQRLTPVAVAGGQSFLELAVGDFHTCGVTSSHSLYCWGYNANGQIDGTTANRSIPTLIFSAQLNANVAHVAVGNETTCVALTASQGVKCWGGNNYGELGNGTVLGTITSTPATVLGLSDVSRISGSGSTLCAIQTGKAYCWGDNAKGKAGLGVPGPILTPTPVPGFDKATDTLTVGHNATCFINHNYTQLACTGESATGIMGLDAPPIYQTSAGFRVSQGL